MDKYDEQKQELNRLQDKLRDIIWELERACEDKFIHPKILDPLYEFKGDMDSTLHAYHHRMMMAAVEAPSVALGGVLLGLFERLSKGGKIGESIDGDN